MSLLMDAPPPGLVGVGVLEALEALVSDDMSVEVAGYVVRAVALVHGRADVVLAQALAVFSRGNGAQTEGATDTTAWLANVTKRSGRDAKRAVKRAGVLAALPELSAALADGAVSASHVDAIAGIVPARLLPKAGALVAAAKNSTPEELAHAAHRFVADSEGDDGAGRAARHKAGQRVHFFDREDGMRAMFGQWDPTVGAAIERAVDLVADELWRAKHPNRNPTRHEETTLKFRRAEAVSEIARRVLARTEQTDTEPAAPDVDAVTPDDAGDEVLEGAEVPAPPACDAPRPGSVAAQRAKAKAKRLPSRWAVPLVSILIDLPTLSGEVSLRRVCELFDGTPISPDTVRRLACDAALIPMVLGSLGEVLHQGKRIYSPTVAQRHAVAIRDRHCMFPGCRRPAKWTDVHHIVPYPRGGTDLDNLLLLCDKHHHLVHEGHWRLDGTAVAFTVHRPDGTLFEHYTRGPP